MAGLDKLTLLSDRELLIVMIERFERMEEDVVRILDRLETRDAEFYKRLNRLELDMREIKTKVAVYASAIGMVAGAISQLLSHFLKTM